MWIDGDASRPIEANLDVEPLVYGFERDADFSSSSITIFDVVFVWFEFSDPPSLHIASFLAPAPVLYILIDALDPHSQPQKLGSSIL
jgi:hypothetical protein